jgi:hypothetical protein
VLQKSISRLNRCIALDQSLASGLAEAEAGTEHLDRTKPEASPSARVNPKSGPAKSSSAKMGLGLERCLC